MGQVRKIRTVGDPVLRKKAWPVRHINRSLETLIDDMLETMYMAEGVGLAAPQVGVSKRIIVIDVGEGPVELINPEIITTEGEGLGTEGCLSVPGKAGEVPRASRLRVSGLNREGKRVWYEAEGLFARVLQHEIDHLDGVLFIDRAERVWDVPPETELRIVFMGTPEFAVPILEKLVVKGCMVVAVVTRPDRPRGRGQRLRASPVKEAALRWNLPVLQPERPGDPSFLEELAGLRPDVIVTAAYGRILPPVLLELPARACLNVHPSLLPLYRGPAPVHRALMRGEECTGVSIMYMSEEMDAGDIVLQREMEIEPGEDRGNLEKRLAETGADLLLQALRLVAGEEVTRLPQEHKRATYAPALAAEEEEIRWARPAREVINIIRALAPSPGARTAVGSRWIKILRASVVPALEGRTEPGRVLEVRPREGFVVAAGEGAVLVEAVKPAGGKAMSAADYLNGNPLHAGDRLSGSSHP